MTPLHLIAAMSENRVLSHAGRIPWHLPEETLHFRRSCAGRWLLLGRRTLEQMQGWFQPGHTPLVLSRNELPRVPGSPGRQVSSLAEARSLAAAGGADRLMVLGGGEVYAATLPEAERVILTRVHLHVPGDVFFPALPENEWSLETAEHFPAGAGELPAWTVERYVRRIPPCLSALTP